MLMLLINSTCFSQKVKKEDEIEISKSGVVELKKCVNSKIDKDQYKVKKGITVDLYVLTLKLEEYFIEKEVMTDRSKSSYYKLVNHISNSDINSSNRIQKDMIQIMNDFNYNGRYFVTEIIQSCPHYVLTLELNLSKTMKGQFDSMDKLFAFDPYEQEYLEEIVSIVPEGDFENVIYRAPVLLLLYDLIIFNINESNRD